MSGRMSAWAFDARSLFVSGEFSYETATGAFYYAAKARVPVLWACLPPDEREKWARIEMHNEHAVATGGITATWPAMRFIDIPLSGPRS